MKSPAIFFLALSPALMAAPRLALSTITVGPVIVTPGTNGATQTVQVFNLGDGTLNLKASSPSSWLSPTVGASAPCSQPGGTCLPIAIALNTSSLAAGTYTGYVTVTDPNAIDSPQDIAVTINATGVPGSVNVFVNPFGSDYSRMTIPIYTAGTGVNGSVTTQTGGSWLQFQNGNAGLVTFPYPWFLQINALPGQAPGTYNGTVTISGSSVASDNKTINVTLNISSSPIIDTSAGFATRLTAYENGPVQYAFQTFSNVGIGTLNVTAANATASNSFLAATVLNGNTVQIAANPKGLAPGTYTGSVTISSNASNSSAVTIPVEFIVAPAGPPVISANGIVNIATYAQLETAAPGGIEAIYGSQFATNDTAATNASTPLATTLGGAQVLVNNTPAPLFFVSPGQVNFQVPYLLAPGSTAAVQVVTGGKPGNIRPLSISATAPRLLYFLSFIQGTYGIIVNASDGSLPLPSGTVVPGFQCHPAKPGDTLVIYSIGFGQTNPAAVEGQAANSTNLESIAGVTVTMGGAFLGNPVTANADFAGLTPTAVGLYQINVRLPDVSPLGAAVPLFATVNGIESNAVTLAISANGK